MKYALFYYGGVKCYSSHHFTFFNYLLSLTFRRTVAFHVFFSHCFHGYFSYKLATRVPPPHGVTLLHKIFYSFPSLFSLLSTNAKTSISVLHPFLNKLWNTALLCFSTFLRLLQEKEISRHLENSFGPTVLESCFRLGGATFNGLVPLVLFVALSKFSFL